MRQLRSILLFSMLGVFTLFPGCIGKPSQANILLRKQNQEISEKVESLERQHYDDLALIHTLQDQRPTVPTLPSDRLSQLFTTRSLQFGRLTGGIDNDRAKPGDDAVKVYVVPLDQDGQPLKAAGTFDLQVFDLAEPDHPLVGKYTFDVEAAKKNWYGSVMSYTYAFTLPWQEVPGHSELTIKVTFTEALTGLTFDSQTAVKVNLASPTTSPATMPSTRPATQPG